MSVAARSTGVAEMVPIEHETSERIAHQTAAELKLKGLLCQATIARLK
jgi:hypothetical protein